MLAEARDRDKCLRVEKSCMVWWLLVVHGGVMVSHVESWFKLFYLE